MKRRFAKLALSGMLAVSMLAGSAVQASAAESAAATETAAEEPAAAETAGTITEETAVAEGKTIVGEDVAVADVTGGQLRGFIDRGTYTFLGVQYAQAGRFEAPQPVEAWEGVKNCFNYGEVCPVTTVSNVDTSQFFKGNALTQKIENEECHYLNIWSKSMDSSAKKPVMVYFHGGGMSNGCGADTVIEEGKGLTDFGDVVTVTLNHRLNVLGFLDVSEYGEDYANSGNAGIDDLTAALQWIHDNIEAFGGDPDNVTIFGQSGGSAKVMTVMGYPAASGLFHKAICESGTASAHSQEDAKKVTQKVMETLGFTTIDELLAVDYKTLNDTANYVINELNESGELSGYFSWGPEINESYPEVAGSPEGFAELTKDIPLLIGTTFGEFSSNGLGLVNNEGEEFVIGSLTEEEVLERLTATYGDNAQAILDAFKEAYPTHPVADVLYINKRAWSKDEDGGMFGQANLFANAKAAMGGAPVYNWVFAYDYPIFGGATATHGAELAFVFHNVGLVSRLVNDDEAAYALQDVVCQAWVNFARTGDPSQEGLEWAPYTEENGTTMIFDVESGTKDFHDRELMSLLNQTSGSNAAEAAEVERIEKASSEEAETETAEEE